MDFPVKVAISVKQKTLKDPKDGRAIVEELAYAELLSKMRKLNLLQINENAYEITGNISIVVAKRLTVT